MNDENNQFIISIMSRDRVGIVHEVSEAIAGLGGNIADLRQSVLRGYFTMILQVSFPAGVKARRVEKDLTAAGSGGGIPLRVCVDAVDGAPGPVPAAALDHAYVLTASGEDRIGFVATVTRFCADHGINILDLSTAVAEGSYIMILLVDLSTVSAVDGIREALDDFTRETGLRFVLQHYDLFKATNEIAMR